MSKYRVYELAKEFHTESKNVLQLLTQNGYEVKNTLSSVGEAERDLIRKLMTKGKPEEKGAPSAKQGAKPLVKEEQPRQTQGHTKEQRPAPAHAGGRRQTALECVSS